MAPSGCFSLFSIEPLLRVSRGTYLIVGRFNHGTRNSTFDNMGEKKIFKNSRKWIWHNLRFWKEQMSHLKRFEKPFGPQGGISRLGLGALALGTRFFCFSSLRCLVLVILEF